MIKDPYPEELDDLPFNPPGAPLLAVTTDTALVAAITRLAQAVEQLTLATLHPVQNAPSAPLPQYHVPAPPAPLTTTAAPLAALPPVQTVAARPACPRHGIDKVAPSKQFQGFYCQAKAAPGEPANTRGYCSWSVRL